MKHRSNPHREKMLPERSVVTLEIKEGVAGLFMTTVEPGFPDKGKGSLGQPLPSADCSSPPCFLHSQMRRGEATQPGPSFSSSSGGRIIQDNVGLEGVEVVCQSLVRRSRNEQPLSGSCRPSFLSYIPEDTASRSFGAQGSS